MPIELLHFFAVGLGGAMGAMLRNFLTTLMESNTRHWFPVGTLTVNLCACFITGCFIPAVINDTFYFILIVGFLGGFSTLSSLNFEAVAFFASKRYARCLLYLCIEYGSSFGAACLGCLLVSTLLG